MINKIKELPKNNLPLAETIKMNNMAAAYPQDIHLFACTDTNAYISLLGGDMIISGKINAQEVKEFISFLRPSSVFSNEENLTALFGENAFEKVNVVMRKNCFLGKSNMFSYDFSSKEAYELLKTGGFSLPQYEYFATDYCLRKNRGLIRVFGKKDTCIAITVEDERYRLLSGIVSKQKGQGGSLLLAAISGEKSVLAVCRDELLSFYKKYGFEPLYKAGYWRKHN